ncbi:hypothetical protein FH972_022313 [Carpinus fangiana]|uniref:F-box domain-containing protein n=1 Tax=Carpinus fangiana TaxID=176857 RepID=A0A5N6KU44_9ROSI|nr:hypothetical protein FH972_022313 [Carpinus fangiana]
MTDSTPLFEDLATELLAQVYLHCNSIKDVLSLSSTCQRLRSIYTSGRSLQILARAANVEYGPFEDAIQLVTYNESQPAHLFRDPPLSFPLLKQIVEVGKVAVRWADDIYPFKKWKDNFEDRRLLIHSEKLLLRRALYRLWLYRRAFATSTTLRTIRMSPQQLARRAALLHNFDNAALAEMADVQATIRETLASNVCPSNGAIQRKFRRRFPETNYQLQFNMHLNYPTPTEMALSTQQAQQYKYYAKYRPTATHEPGCEGWGDDISHYYVVEDMLKLDPGQILMLKTCAPSKSQVEAYVRGLGPWFENNGDTFAETLEWVLRQRGVEVAEFNEAVQECEAGVVTL